MDRRPVRDRSRHQRPARFTSRATGAAAMSIEGIILTYTALTLGGVAFLAGWVALAVAGLRITEP